MTKMISSFFQDFMHHHSPTQQTSPFLMSLLLKLIREVFSLATGGPGIGKCDDSGTKQSKALLQRSEDY